MTELRKLPDWAAGLIVFVVSMSVVLTFVVSIMLVHHFLSGPPGRQDCGIMGVHQVVRGTNDTTYGALIVCNDGYAYTR